MGIRRPEIEFFATRSVTPVDVLATGAHTVLTLPVTTTVAGQIVKLDSVVPITYLTDASGTFYLFSTKYELYRDNTLLAQVDLDGTYQKPDLSTEEGNIYPNLTWYDTPPGPGTFTYSVVINMSTTVRVLRYRALTRSLNAIVFPPVF